MRSLSPIFVLATLLLTGCVTIPPKDYTAFRQHQPRSILVLPPQNLSTDINAGYSVLTTTTRPLSELGYYVFPVAMVDQFLKENGLPTAAEMHGAPLDKLHEVFGADAVLYITVEQYGSKYQVFSSNIVVAARAKLLDCLTGTILWEGRVMVNSAGQSGLLEALVTQVINKLTDSAHQSAILASYQLLTPVDQGLLKGPRHPEFGKPAAH